MTISKIRIANFKSFADQTVELNDFNLLVGANASGKSNFVQAFKFLSDIATHGLEEAISLQGGLSIFATQKIGNAQPLSFPLGYSRRLPVDPQSWLATQNSFVRI